MKWISYHKVYNKDVVSRENDKTAAKNKILVFMTENFCFPEKELKQDFFVSENTKNCPKKNFSVNNGKSGKDI